jgi:Tol biopolymer transport system component
MKRYARVLLSLGMATLVVFALSCTCFSSGAATQSPAAATGSTKAVPPDIEAGPPTANPKSGGEPTVEQPFAFPALEDMGRIVFYSIRDNGLPDIYLMNADGGDAKYLAGKPEATDIAPAWSPDGRWIAFISSGPEGTFDIQRVRPDGSELSNLTHDPANEDTFDWSPDGTQILFASDRGGDYDLYVMNADGSGVRRLTRTGKQDEVAPVWSPDGNSIACLCGPSDGNTTDVCVMNADGSGETNLTPEDPDVDDVVWSPDGTRLAFGMPLWPEEIWVMAPDGSGKQNLSNNPADDGGIAYSPDGTMIAFRSDRDGKKNQIYILRLSNSYVYPLTDNDLVNVQPGWSPDSTWVVFLSAKSLGEFDYEIYAVRIDGEGLTNLTSNPAKDMGPDWEPL